MHVELHCSDFMDRVPVAQLPLEVALFVTPLYFHPADQTGVPGDPPPQHPHATIDPEFDLAEVFTAALVTDADGRAAIDFHVATAWQRVAQIRLGDALPRTVIGYLNVGGTPPWIELYPHSREVKVMHPDDEPKVGVIVDAAKLIVGHTTTTTTRLWFQLHGAPGAGFQVSAELTAPGEQLRKTALAFTTDRLRGAQWAVDGLRPGTSYAVTLVAENGSGARHVLARGSVRTIAASPTRWDIAFTSCHSPHLFEGLAPWMRRAARPSADMMLMIGDQIYTDGMSEEEADADTWFTRYVAQYNRLWGYQPFRDVLRRTPTTMMLDDHEVADDWGVSSLDDIGRTRWQGALRAYRRFQDPLNPPGRNVPLVWDFGWRVGPIAVYMLDERSHRGFDKSSNVLGEEQLARFRAWTESAETRAADVVIIASGVPFAFLPIARLLELLGSTVAVTGEVLGMAVGAAVGGPVGLVVGAFLGVLGASLLDDHVIDSLREPDYHDQWTFEDNQPELAKVLDVLFDLANDISNGVPGPRPRAVFVVSGDVHIGGCHLIRSRRTGEGHDHRRNNLIFQFIASPSSTPPPGSLILKAFVTEAPAQVDLRRARFIGDDPDAEPFNPLDVTRFLLDSNGEQHYAAEYLGQLYDYNFGSMQIERSGPRAYRFNVAVEGSERSLNTLFELDLDAPLVRPRNLIGERLQTTGTPVLLRVHEQGSGFGPNTDRLDVEAVVQLDTEPGRSFGFTLREDAGGAAHEGMLALLRDAFNTNTAVTIDYDRTGPQNGVIVRAAQA